MAIDTVCKMRSWTVPDLSDIIIKELFSFSST